MVMVYTAGKKYECAKVNKIQFKLLIDESGQEYLLMYDFTKPYLYTLHRGVEKRNGRISPVLS